MQKMEIFSFQEEKGFFKCFPESMYRDLDTGSSLMRLDQHTLRVDLLIFMCALMAEAQVTFSPDIQQVESQESDDVMKLLTQQSFVRKTI